MEKNVLILSDFVGFGNVAMATSRAVLTGMGCTVFCLPTALISNTWNFGRCAVLDTTDYLRRSAALWEELGFRLDAVLIGYLADEDQAAWAIEQCRKWQAQGIPVFFDPIFADNGKLYKGITPERIAFLRNLVECADYSLPNATEACFLADTSTPQEALAKLPCPGSLLITGAENAVLLRTGNRTEVLTYIPIPGSFPGAGDAFTALFAGGILSGLSPAASARSAMDTTKDWIQRAIDENWNGMGLPVERYL